MTGNRTEKLAVVGLGRFGQRLVRQTVAAGIEVIALDKEQKLINLINDHVPYAYRLDATSEAALLDRNIDSCDVVVVGIGQDFEANVLATSTLKRIGVQRVIARASSDTRGEILRRVGADDIVFPEEESANRWAFRLLLPHLLESFELGPDHAMVQLHAPESLHDKNLKDLRLRQTYGVNLVAIRSLVDAGTEKASAKPSSQNRTKGPHEIFTVPDADTIIRKGDILVLVGNNDDLASFPDS